MEIPAEGQETEDFLKAELLKKAIGYEIEEVSDIESSKGVTHIVRTKHIPGDLKALQLYRKLYGDGGI